MRQISPVWQRETRKAGQPCHPGAAEAVETPGATLSRVRDVLGRNYEGGLVLDAFVQGGQLHPVLLSQAGEIEVCGVFAR